MSRGQSLLVGTIPVFSWYDYFICTYWINTHSNNHGFASSLLSLICLFLETFYIEVNLTHFHSYVSAWPSYLNYNLVLTLTQTRWELRNAITRLRTSTGKGNCLVAHAKPIVSIMLWLTSRSSWLTPVQRANPVVCTCNIRKSVLLETIFYLFVFPHTFIQLDWYSELGNN